MDGEPSNGRIIGVGVVIFCSILLGVGIHHMVSIGTCSSTGYSANYGPVKHCPPGTGWWFAFLFGGIFGTIGGALAAGLMALIFGGIFGGIGFGALSIILDSHTSSGTKIFGGVFGGCFAIVGVIALFFVARRAFGALSSGSKRSDSGGGGLGAGAFGPSATASNSDDPILGAYTAVQAATPAFHPSAPAAPVAPAAPMHVVPGLPPTGGQHHSANAVDELEKLAELHKRGAVSDAEFAAAKAKLLGEM